MTLYITINRNLRSETGGSNESKICIVIIRVTFKMETVKQKRKYKYSQTFVLSTKKHTRNELQFRIGSNSFR